MTGTSPLPPPPTRGSEGTRGLPAAGGPWPHCGSRSAGSCGPPPRAPPAAGSIHAFSCLRHLPRRARGEDGSARGRPLPGSLSVTPPPPPPRCEEGERGKKEGERLARGEGGRLAALPPASLPLPGAAAAEPEAGAAPRRGAAAS